MQLEYVVGVAIYLALIFSPALLLPLLWLRLRHIPASRYDRLIVVLISLSYAHLLAGFFLKRMLWGPDYSDRLYITLGSGVIFCFFLAASAVVIKPPLWLRIGSTAFATSLAWFAAYAINTVV